MRVLACLIALSLVPDVAAAQTATDPAPAQPEKTADAAKAAPAPAAPAPEPAKPLPPAPAEPARAQPEAAKAPPAPANPPPEKKAAPPAVVGEPAKAPAPGAQVPGAPATASADKKKVDDDLAYTAAHFFAALLARDVDKIAGYCKAPFYFESKATATDADVRKKWESALQSDPLEGVHFLGVDYYTPDEMIAKYGKPPDRLSAWPLKGGMLSVANFGGHPVVVLWKNTGVSWQAVGFHD
jgi:hypothetical protein